MEESNNTIIRECMIGHYEPVEPTKMYLFNRIAKNTQ